MPCTTICSLMQSPQWALVYTILQYGPGDSCFDALVGLCVDVDAAANDFWRLRS